MEGLFGEIPFSDTKVNRLVPNTLKDPEHDLGAKVAPGDDILGIVYAYRGGYFIGDGARKSEFE